MTAREGAGAIAMHAYNDRAWQLSAPNSVGQLGAIQCCFCAAWLFPGEGTRIGGGRISGGSLCCLGGSLLLDPVRRSDTMDDLFASSSRGTVTRNARALNNALALASVVVSHPAMPGGSTFTPCFAISGRLHHHLGPLAPDAGAAPRFAQLYVHDACIDGRSEFDHRLSNMWFPSGTSAPERRRITHALFQLQALLHRANPYVQDCIR